MCKEFLKKHTSCMRDADKDIITQVERETRYSLSARWHAMNC
jgi:hypothetical protein